EAALPAVRRPPPHPSDRGRGDDRTAGSRQLPRQRRRRSDELLAVERGRSAIELQPGAQSLRVLGLRLEAEGDRVAAPEVLELILDDGTDAEIHEARVYSRRRGAAQRIRGP